MKRRILLLVLSAGLVVPPVPASERPDPPPNAPGEFLIAGNLLTIRYNGRVIMKGVIGDGGGGYTTGETRQENHGAVSQVFTLTASKGQQLTVNDTITGGDESFPCESDRSSSGSAIVRSSIGMSMSRLNRAVYDRTMDWVISVDEPAQVRVLALEAPAGQRLFSMLVIGNEISFRFRPRFYQKHRGLEYFEPWTYRVWDKPVVGWCSWFAYYDSVSELKMKQAADVLAETLKPYGLEFLQMDDGYQQNPVGWPDRWLTPNEKFPGGLKNLSEYISDRGLLPGIWTNTSVQQDSMARAHASMFVEDEAGKPSKNRWIGYALDGSNPRAVDEIIRPLYRDLRKMGWKYFKVDALRHLRYEGYNSHASFFAKKNVDPVDAFRNVARAIRSEIGGENFLLGCWGIRPELVGIIDGCRVGGDGFSLAGMAQYNSFNNIVWRNDPDHIELSNGEAYRSCMVTSMTGSLFMLTDRPERYATEWVEAARRSIPVIFTLPGQLYDVDPSRSISLERVGGEMSGSGERVFDASRSTPVDLFLLEINRSFEDWVLLGRTGESTSYIRFRDLGLDERKEYAVFEFWTKTYCGSFGEGFDPGRINQKFGCQLFCIRERTGHPQLLATSRHITCGSYEVATLSWSPKSLSGMSTMIPGEPYNLYILEPVGVEFAHAECDGARIVETEKRGLVRTIVLRPDRLKTVDWTIRYQ
jgi:alpha-galactosidase